MYIHEAKGRPVMEPCILFPPTRYTEVYMDRYTPLCVKTFKLCFFINFIFFQNPFVDALEGTEAGWCQVRKIFYLAAATYYVAAAT